MVCRIPLRTELYPSDLKTQFVPHSKRSLPRLYEPMLMLYTEIFADIHVKHIKLHCGQNTEFVNVGAGGT
jgi:hypothetical protein